MIHFPAIDSGRYYKFSTADLQNDQYFFSAEDLPANAIILEEEIPADQLFPSPLASEMSNLPNKSKESLVSFKRKFLEAGLTLRSLDGVDQDEILDRASKYFYPVDLEQRAKRLLETPQPILLVPLSENMDFFVNVFSSESDPETRAREHCINFEPVRAMLQSMVMVESLILDVCSLGNGVISLMGEKISRLMNAQKKYSAGQFMLMLPERFAFQFLFKLLEIWGYQDVPCTHSDGRKVLRTSSMFLFENTIASSHNQLSGKCVARKFQYLEPRMRVGQGFGEIDEHNALLKKDPYKMNREECIAQMEKVSLFDDDEEYFRNDAPLYELQFIIFDWAARSEELFGVKYVYGIDQGAPTKSVCDVMFVKDTQNMAMAKVIVSIPLVKFRVQFSQDEGKHVPKASLFKR